MPHHLQGMELKFSHLQAYEIFLVTSQEKKSALARAAFGQTSVAEGPVVLVFCANPARSGSRYGVRGSELYSVQDATIATAFAHLSATDLGLGSVWIGAFDDEAVSKILGRKDLKPVAILAIGYPAETPYKTSRRKLEDIVHEI